MNNAIILPPEGACASEIIEKISQRQHLQLVLVLSIYLHHTDPFDKLVSNDQLSYLPNLYLRQYKLIDDLARIRHDFPEQKLLIPRPRTTWDTVLEDAKFASHIMQERRKLKIATAATVVRQCKNQAQRIQLRAEEQYHFNRITSGFLAEGLVEHFKKFQEAVLENKVEQKVAEKQQPSRKNQDNVFLDDNEDDGFVQPEPDFFDEFLKPGGVSQGVNNQEEQAPLIHYEPVSTYITEKYASRKEQIDKECQFAINRKGSLKKINECVRKRLRFREEEQETIGRSLASATVFLSNLLNTTEQTKAPQLIDPISNSECLFGGEKAPRKKKEEDTMDLRWSAQEIQKMENRNDKNTLKKGKFDSGVLMLSVGVEEDEYKKIFEKQISGDKRFPPSLRNIPEAAPLRRPKYYNEFHDNDYEWFLIKHNKSTLFAKFAQKSQLIFPENYSQDDVEDAQNVSAGKLFIYKPEKLKERVIFLKEERQVKTSLRSQPKHPIDKSRALLLAFLVQKYLRQFGNNWKNIAQLICRHVAFAQKHVTIEFVQQIYQMVIKLAQNRKNMPGTELWDKRVLPYQYWNTQNYTVFDSKQPGSMDVEGQSGNSEKMETQDEDDPITSQSYTKMLEEEVEEIETNLYQKGEQNFKEFTKHISPNLSKLITSSDPDDIISAISKVLDSYDGEEQVKPYSGEYETTHDTNTRNHILTESLRGEIKVAAPFRKKKSINERNNELVKLLQALRNRNNPNPANAIQKKPEDKPAGPVPPQKGSVPPVPHKNPEVQSKKGSMKSPEKPVKKLGKKTDKHKDQDDKK